MQLGALGLGRLRESGLSPRRCSNSRGEEEKPVVRGMTLKSQFDEIRAERGPNRMSLSSPARPEIHHPVVHVDLKEIKAETRKTLP